MSSADPSNPQPEVPAQPADADSTEPAAAERDGSTVVLEIGGCTLSMRTDLPFESGTTGYKTWDGAHVMCQYLRQHPELVAGKRYVTLSLCDTL